MVIGLLFYKKMWNDKRVYHDISSLWSLPFHTTHKDWGYFQSSSNITSRSFEHYRSVEREVVTSLDLSSHSKHTEPWMMISYAYLHPTEKENLLKWYDKYIYIYIYMQFKIWYNCVYMTARLEVSWLSDRKPLQNLNPSQVGACPRK